MNFLVREMSTRGSSLVVKVVASALCGVGAVFLVGYFFLFDDFAAPNPDPIYGTPVAIVFSGGHGRVDAGLRLLQKGQISTLYVTGMRSEEYARSQFVEELRYYNPDIPDVVHLLRCCVEFGFLARTTLQNGLEASCWVNDERIAGPLLLITSRSHMARSLTVFRASLPGRTILPYPVEDAADAPPYDQRERVYAYIEYLASAIVARLPKALLPASLTGPFHRGCPPTSSAL